MIYPKKKLGLEIGFFPKIFKNLILKTNKINYKTMKIGFVLMVSTALLISCTKSNEMDTSNSKQIPIVGTWKLISGTLIEKGDTTITDYSKNVSFIKVINDSHFAFLHHDLTKGKDTTSVFSAGGGSYTLKNNQYTERLEYCSDRNWEGHDFNFTIEIKNDTLIQTGMEKIDSIGVNRLNIEKYFRLKK